MVLLSRSPRAATARGFMRYQNFLLACLLPTGEQPGRQKGGIRAFAEEAIRPGWLTQGQEDYRGHLQDISPTQVDVRVPSSGAHYLNPCLRRTLSTKLASLHPRQHLDDSVFRVTRGLHLYTLQLSDRSSQLRSLRGASFGVHRTSAAASGVCSQGSDAPVCSLPHRRLL